MSETREDFEGRLNAPPAEPQAADMTVSPRRAVRRARWAEAVFVVALIAYAVLAVLARRYAYFEWDIALARSIQSMTMPGFYALMRGVSWVGSGVFPFALVICSGVALIKAGFKVEGTVCLIGVALGNGVNHLLKFITGRPRPIRELVQVMTSARFESFPSGHVMFFVVYFGFLFFLAYVLLRRGLVRRVSLVALGLLIALVGASRIYLGAHWPSDVVGAYLAGGLWLLVMIEVYRRWKARRDA